MISFFRRALSSWLVLGLLGVVLVAMLITGVGVGGLSDGGSAGGGSLAKVGREAIGAAEAEQATRRQIQGAQQQNPGLDMATFVRAGGFEDSLDQLIAARALEVFGRNQGMVASRKLVDSEIAGIGGLTGLNGKFDKAAFAAFLQEQRMSETQLREAIAGGAIRQQIIFPAIGGVTLPAGMVAPYASLLLEEREGLIGLVAPAAMAGGPAPTDAEIGAFYKRRIAAYTMPERRVLRYAAFGREDVAAKAAIADEDVAAYYKANAATYAPRELRDFSQVVLDSEAKARAFAAKVAAGTPFAKAAADAGFAAADTKIGRKTRAELATLSSPAVAAAAFAAAKGGISAPAKSAFGWHVVQVDAVETVPGRALAAVRTEIAAQLGKQRADEALSNLVASVEEAIGGGASFDDVVRDQRLRITTTPPLLADGRAPETPGWQPTPEVAALLKPAFETSTDEDPTVETIAANERFALLGVTRVLPAAPLPLAEVRARVVADLVADRAQRRAKAVADAIVAKANAGVPLPAAFVQAGVKLPPQVAKGRRMDLSRAAQGGKVPPALLTLFSMKQGRTSALPAPQGQGWLVVHVSRVVPGDASKVPALLNATRSQLGSLLGDEYGEQLAHAAEAEVGVKRDAKAIARLKAQLGGGASAAQ